MAEGSSSEVLAGAANWSVFHGDCLALLRSLPDNSIDSMVTDPPSGIAFMNRAWDKDKGGRDKWIAWLAEIMAEALRVLKPGAHGLVWALPRTSGWTSMALEDAGFEIIDSVHHLFGSGFPKALNVSKAIDEADFRAWLKAHPSERMFVLRVNARAKELRKAKKSKLAQRLKKRVGESLRRRAGLLREVTGSYTASGNAGTPTDEKGGTYGVGAENSEAVELYTTRGATERSRAWDGWATALKPSHEVWWLVRKPVEWTIAANVQQWGCGAMNIDATRVGFASDRDKAAAAAAAAQRSCQDQNAGRTAYSNFDDGPASLAPYLENMAKGRWAPNLVLTHDARCVRRGTAEVAANPTWDTPNRATEPSAFTGSEVSRVRHAERKNGSTNFAMQPGGEHTRHHDDTESVDVWECVDGCPVRDLDRQSGTTETHGGTVHAHHAGLGYGGGAGSSRPVVPSVGGASRYYPQFEWTELDRLFRYQAKPSRAERDTGLDHFRKRTAGEATEREDDTDGLASPRAGSGRTGGARNIHPTGKGVELMRWATKLVTRPGGVVLDLFGGSGTGGVAAIVDGFRWIAAEMNDTDEEPFVSIARARISYAEGRVFIPRESLRAPEPPRQTSLFQKESA